MYAKSFFKSDWLLAYIRLRIKTRSEQFWPCDTKLCRRLNNDINIRKSTTSLIEINFSLLIIPLATTTEPDPLSFIPKYHFKITSAVGLLSFWVRVLFGLLFKTIIVMSKGYKLQKQYWRVICPHYISDPCILWTNYHCIFNFIVYF